MSEAPRYEYSGPPELAQAVEEALREVIDPEMALSIVSLGLVYGVELREHHAKARITMTSAACPVSDMIASDVIARLAEALGEGFQVEVEFVWDPPWDPERMSASARAAMGWD